MLRRRLSPAEADTQLGAGVVNSFTRTPQVVLPDLAPATTYRFRFVAQSSGGGPVYGVAPEGGEASPTEGLEGTFTTPAPPAPLPAVDPCPNVLFRSGPSAFLPDCRAYEMVTPVDKANGEIRHLVNSLNEPIHYNRSTPEGAKLTYSSFRAFGDANPPRPSPNTWPRGGRRRLEHARHLPAPRHPLLAPGQPSRPSSAPSATISVRAGSGTTPTRRSPPTRSPASPTSTRSISAGRGEL